MQHAALREAQVKPAPRARDCHIHQAAFFIQSAIFTLTVLVREQTFFQASDKHGMKLQAFGRMHCHQMQCIILFARLMFARLQRSVSKK